MRFTISRSNSTTQWLYASKFWPNLTNHVYFIVKQYRAILCRQWTLTQKPITSSKSAMEILEQEWDMFKVKSNNSRNCPVGF